MYKIINKNLIKNSLLYFILCLLLSFTFSKVCSINELLCFYPTLKIEDFQGYLILSSRLILWFTIILILIQDFNDLYGSRYLFIHIRKLDNKNYFYYLLIKESISLLLLSSLYTLSQYLSSVFIDSFDLILFTRHLLNFFITTALLTLILLIIQLFFKESGLLSSILALSLIYVFCFSTNNVIILSILNFSHSPIIIQLFTLFLLIHIFYKLTQRRF